MMFHEKERCSYTRAAAPSTGQIKVLDPDQPELVPDMEVHSSHLNFSAVVQQEIPITIKDYTYICMQYVA